MTMQGSIKAHLRSLEEQLLDPQVRRSRETLARLLADEFVEFGSSGTVYDKQRIIKELSHSSPIQMSLSQFKVRLLAPGVALATYRVLKRDEMRGETKHSLRSSIWKQLDGRWQILFHQGTPTAAP